MKSSALTLARARELARLVKGVPKSRKKGARKKTVRSSTHLEVSQSFYDRYLGHFGDGSSIARRWAGANAGLRLAVRVDQVRGD